MPQQLRFRVSAIPVPQPRARVVQGQRGKTHAFEDSRATNWKQIVTLEAQLAVQHAKRSGGWSRDGWFALDLVIRRGRALGDVDNFAKGCMDAMTRVVWDDDRQVLELRATIARSAAGPPGVDVSVRRLPSDEAVAAARSSLASPPANGRYELSHVIWWWDKLREDDAQEIAGRVVELGMGTKAQEVGGQNDG